jgi:mannitol 2-dehydrogenase
VLTPYNPTKKVITLTVTEGGYNYNVASGEFDFENAAIREELAHPERPKTLFGYLSEALRMRRERSFGGCTIQSCDNIQGNGRVLEKMLCSFIGQVDAGLLEWVKENVAFPNSMVDRITPATVDGDRELLREKFGVDDLWPVVCEPFIQWVMPSF